MSLLSPRLQLKVAQKQILTPGLVQMVTVLQLNRLELKEMITQEIVKNPVLEESTDEAGEEITPEELLPLLEAEHGPRSGRPADSGSCHGERRQSAGRLRAKSPINGNLFPGCRGDRRPPQSGGETTDCRTNDPLPEPPAATDPFDEIDFGSFFDDYLDPGLQESGLGIGREAVVRDFSLRAGHAGATICARN